MSSLVLHYHPLSSYCQKALIAIDALGIEVERRLLNLGDPAQRAAYLALWPLGKMPLLVDGGRPIPETSVIVEHLQHHPARRGAELVPQDPAAAEPVRLWDRLLDFYVMTPMQALTADLLRPADQRDALGVARARELIGTSYALIDAQLDGKPWLAGDTFSLADCAAAPALFYAVTYVPFAPQHARLAAYFERLVAHPPVARAIEHARPFFQYYPGRAGLARRFHDPDPA